MQNKTLDFLRQNSAECKTSIDNNCASTGFADIALYNKLTQALIGLARATDGNTTPTESTWQTIVTGLSVNVGKANFNDEYISSLIDKAHQEKDKLVPQCMNCASPCGRNNDYDMQLLWNSEQDIFALKSTILSGLRDMAGYAYQAMLFGHYNEEVNKFFYKGLFAVGEEWEVEDLLPIVTELSKHYLTCIKMFETAYKSQEK